MTAVASPFWYRSGTSQTPQCLFGKLAGSCRQPAWPRSMSVRAGRYAVACFLSACGSSSVARTSPTSAGPSASQAAQVVADLAGGNFTAVEGKFDPAMMKPSGHCPCRRHGPPARTCWVRTEATVRRRLPGRADSTSNRYPSRGPMSQACHHRLQPRRDHCRVALRTVAAVAKRPLGRSVSDRFPQRAGIDQFPRPRRNLHELASRRR